MGRLRYIKKLDGLPMQLGSRVSKAHTHISKAPDVRAIMDMQDVRVGYIFNACKTCGLAGTIWLQCTVGPVDHS
jgi:hypothetical protein